MSLYYRIIATIMQLILAVVFVMSLHCVSGISPEKDDPSSLDRQFQVTNVHSSEDVQLMLGYLTKYGYLPETSTHNLRQGNEPQKALKKFQKFAKLKVTGQLDDNTASKMKTPRCGVADRITALDEKRRRKRFSVIAKWGKRGITYKFNNYTSDMCIEKQRLEIMRAFQVWSDGTPLSFQEDHSDAADITISFFRGRHGDGYPFDGSGRTLAHAFFPGQGVRSGNIHFDDDEDWTTDVVDSSGTSLFMVAVHELGHALGLGHSSKLDSVMLPFYQGHIPNFKLGSDDRSAVNLVYGQPGAIHDGENKEASPDPTTAVEFPRKNVFVENDRRLSREPYPDLCNYEFDAVANIRNELFFIKDENFWRFNDKGELMNKEQTRMSSFWKNFPDVRVDAALARPSDQGIIFISGDQYWLYTDNNHLDPESPRAITDFGLSLGEKVDAACVWNANKQVYFFKGSKLWKHDQEMKATWGWGYPKEISNLGLPDDLDASVLGLDGHNYFFKGKWYWELDDTSLRVRAGYPKDTGYRWFGCHASKIYPATKPTAEVSNVTATNANSGQRLASGEGLNWFQTNEIIFVMTHISLYIAGNS